MSRILQLRNGTLQEWVAANPILAEGEPGLILGSSGNIVIGDGKTPYDKLPQHAWGKDAYDIIVTYGGYTGTKEDFCRQLQSALRLPEQQAGVFTNEGAGWNSFTFPKEFTEDCYVVLTPQDASVFSSVKNITKQGFHYCLYNEDGGTTADPIAVNYLASAVSELNMAQAIAKASGLDPFAYDNLTTLLNQNAEEVVANETAYSMLKRSAMGSSRYLCYLTGLNPDSYFNMVSIAGNEDAINTVLNNADAFAYIKEAPGAMDAIRIGSMPMAKFIAKTLDMDISTVSDMTTFLEGEGVLDAILANEESWNATIKSIAAMRVISANKTAITAMLANTTVMEAIMLSTPATEAMMEFNPSLNLINNNATYRTKFIANTANIDIAVHKPVALELICSKSNLISNIISNEYARNQILGRDLALSKIFADSVSSNAFANNSVAMNAVVASDKLTDLVASNSVAMTSVASSSTASNIVANSERFMTKAMTYKSNAISKMVSGSSGITYLVGSSIAMNKIAADSTTMGYIVGNTTALDKMLASTNAMSIAVKYKVATDKLISSSTYYNKVIASANAMKYIAQTDSVITTYFANANMRTAMIGNATAMGQIVLYEPSRNQLVLNSTYTNAICNSATAMTAIVANTEAMTVMLDNTTAVNSMITYYTNAIQKIANSSTAMSALTKSLSALETFTKNSNAMTYIKQSTTAMNAIMEDTDAKEVFFKGSYGVGYGLYKYSGCSSSAQYANTMQNLVDSYYFSYPAQNTKAMQCLLSSPYAREIIFASKSAWSYISQYSVAMTEIAKDTEATDRFFASAYVGQGLCIYAGISNDNLSNYTFLSDISQNGTPMNVIYANSKIMTLVASSKTAMNVLIEQNTAMSYLRKKTSMDIIMANEQARDLFFQAKYYVGSGLYNYVSSSANFSGANTLYDLINSTDYLKALASDSNAIKAIAESKYAINVLLSDSEALSSVASSSTAMEGFAASEHGLANIMDNTTVLRKLCDSSTAMDKICANQNCMTLITTNAKLLNIFLKYSYSRQYMASSAYIQSMYDNILSTTENTEYFARTKNYTISSYTGTKSDGSPYGDNSTPYNYSVFIGLRYGAYSSYSSASRTLQISHLSNTGVQLGSYTISTSASSGGYDSDTGGLGEFKKVAIGGVYLYHSKSSYPGYVRGWFVHAL